MKILFVCTGNTCRSPMAEALANKHISDNNIESVNVASAGLAAFDGQPPARNAVEAMKEMGIDISGYRAKCVTDDSMADTDYFVPMTSEQKMALLTLGIPSEKIIDFSRPIIDPYGGSLDTYKKCREELKQEIEYIISKVI